jgi:hypothetical protein
MLLFNILNIKTLELEFMVRNYQAKLDDFEKTKNELSKCKCEVGTLKIRFKSKKTENYIHINFYF